jgi:hypothetical protein
MWILKLSAPYIVSPFTYICNIILNTGIFPDRLKYAIIKPILKKGGMTKTYLIIGQYLCLPPFQKLLKNLCIIDLLTI